jgi:hypothetical protein
VTIPAATLPRLGAYALRVIACGHVPGVLSGAELRGKARRYGGRYARQRGKASAALAPHNISPGYALLPDRRRHCAVWLRGGKPVRVVLA